MSNFVSKQLEQISQKISFLINSEKLLNEITDEDIEAIKKKNRELLKLEEELINTNDELSVSILENSEDMLINFASSQIATAIALDDNSLVTFEHIAMFEQNKEELIKLILEINENISEQDIEEWYQNLDLENI